MREPGIFIVDDVAFIQTATASRSARRSPAAASASSYYLETRGDVLLRNKEVFRLWRRLGLEYMFIGVEAIDEDGLQALRKRI